MNRTKIEWTDYTFNPITGCLHGCWYCYAKKMYRRFPALGNPNFVPKFFPERLDELSKLRKPSKIFVCSVADLFAEWTPVEWRNQVLEVMKKYPQHTYQLLTKNPEHIPKDYHFGDNVWVGCTANDNEEAKRMMPQIKKVDAGVRFMSFEPLLGRINECLEGIDWIIVGKLTGSRKLPLKPYWVGELIRWSRYWKIPIFIKNNVNWPEHIQEFPGEQTKLYENT
jgi:protein gp37